MSVQGSRRCVLREGCSSAEVYPSQLGLCRSQLGIVLLEEAVFIQLEAQTLGKLLGAFRWYILLKALDLVVSYFRALQLQLIGFFFNTAMPGAVGGDIVKAIYIMREQQSKRKTPAMLAVLLDRVVGVVALAALFLLLVLRSIDAWQVGALA